MGATQIGRLRKDAAWSKWEHDLGFSRKVQDPIQSDQTPGKVSPADIGPAAAPGWRSVLQAALIARPRPGTGLPGNAGGGMVAGGGAGDANPRASSSERATTWPGQVWTVSTRGKAGAYFSLKFRLPLRRLAPDAPRSAPVPLLSRRAKSALASATASQHLVVGCGSAQRQEGHRPKPTGCLLVKVVELHQGGAAAARPHDDIMVPFGGGLEDFEESGPQLVEGAAGAERELAAAGVGEGEVKPPRPDTDKGIQHLQRRAFLPHRPPCFFSGYTSLSRFRYGSGIYHYPNSR